MTNESLVLVSHPTASDSCIITKGDDPMRAGWICARNAQCSGVRDCTAGPYKVWIKQSDMTRYLAIKLVS